MCLQDDVKFQQLLECNMDLMTSLVPSIQQLSSKDFFGKYFSLGQDYIFFLNVRFLAFGGANVSH